MRICTFNLRVDTVEKNPNNKWVNRLKRIEAEIKEIDSDIFGFQEIKLNQLNDLLPILDEYNFEYLSRDGVEAEGTPIFFKKKKFELLDKGSFYLNTHPSTPGIDWDAAWPRVASYVHLKDNKTGKAFSCFNAHLDNEGKIARKESINLMVSKMKEYGGTMLLIGDFNVFEKDETYLTATSLLNDLKYKATDSMTGNTFHDWGNEIYDVTKKPIDYIMGSNDITANKYKIYVKQERDGYASDHYAVYVDFEIN